MEGSVSFLQRERERKRDRETERQRERVGGKKYRVDAILGVCILCGYQGLTAAQKRCKHDLIHIC